MADRLPDTVFILPNKRSAMHLRHEVKAITDTAGDGEGATEKKRIGRYTSINEFFQELYGTQTSDRIQLLLTLYGCYRTVNEKAESLDEFIHWGNVMLADFDNVDKYMVDAKKIFLNVNDYKSIQDTYEYLTETQKKAVMNFISHFRDRSGRLTVNMDAADAKVKARFLQVWNLLGPLYALYNDTLSDQGLAYEGKIYRQLAEKVKAGKNVKEILSKGKYGRAKRFVFVGLNALNECEKTLLRALRDAGMTEFVWDFSSKEIRDPRNKASFFLRKNIEEFPQAFPLDGELSRPHVRVISVPSSAGQTKLVPQVLDFAAQNGYEPEDNAFVLPDETLLMPAIPGSVEKINITMGYPMTGSAVYSLAESLGRLLLTVRTDADGLYYYYYKPVREIFSSSVIRLVMTDEDRTVADAVIAKAEQFIPSGSLAGTELMDILFGIDTPLKTSLADAGQNAALAARMRKVLGYIKGHLLGGAAEPTSHTEMEAEFIERIDTALQKLSEADIPVLPGTWLRLLNGLLRGENVPFEGDALEGVQVMGTLETRALDFKNLVIFSANEDLFPHRSADNSFIPPELRKGFGMPTVDYQDAMWAYYFYRMIQRAENVWIIYDSRTEGLLSGEESRYIKQLEYHFGFPIERFTAVAPLTPVAEDESIEKTAEDVESLKGERHLSASSMQSYLSCPAKFYYQAVKGLKAEDEVAESMDAATIGTLFHSCMEQLYKGKREVTREDIQQMLADDETLHTMVKTGICDAMKCLEVEGRNIIIEEVVVAYIKGALKHDLDLLRQSGSNRFRIIGLERFLKTRIDGFNFIGFADRIDSYKDGEVRIVDYKTGHVEDDDLLINDSNAEAVVEKLFGESNTGRPKIALQMFLYDLFAHESILHEGEKVINSIYSTAKLLTRPLPDVEESPAFSDLVKERLHTTLAEIADTSVPWRRTSDKHVCSMCDFRSICGR